MITFLIKTYNIFAEQIESWATDRQNPLTASDFMKWAVPGNTSIKDFLNGVIKATNSTDFQKPRRFFAAVDKGEVLAFADLQFYKHNLSSPKHEINILSIAVNPKYQGKGIGTEFLKMILERNITPDTTDINAFVHKDNVKSLRMFTSAKVTKNNYKFTKSNSTLGDFYLFNCNLQKTKQTEPNF